MEFAENLKYLRNTRQFTQKELSNILGLSANCICEWEKGRSEPSITTIKKIADLFDVSTDYLLGLEDDFGIRTATPSSATAGESLTAEERKVLEQYRNLPEQLRKLIRQQLDVYSSTEELLFKPDKKV